MLRISLSQLLELYDMEEIPVDRVQIVMPDRDWDDPDELSVNSDLLITVRDWSVTELRSCKTSSGDPILRVGISPIRPWSYPFSA